MPELTLIKLKTVTLGNMYAILIALVLLLPVVSVLGQKPYFRNILLPVDIQQTTVTCLYQDFTNAMWIGTGNGLYHYDGNNFTYFQGPDKQVPLHVTALFMTSDHVLWLGTRKGDIYQMEKDSLHLFAPEEGNPKVSITGFSTDKLNNLWFSTYGEGVYCYDGKHITNINTDDGLTDNYCYTIAPDEQDRFWVATDGGISVCSIRNGKKSIQKITTAEGLPDNMVLSLTKEGTTMWAGMQDAGICRVDIQTSVITPVATNGNWKFGPVNALVTGKNWLWASTEQNGIVSIESSTGSIIGNYTGTENLNISRISHLYADKQGNYWVVAGNQLLLSLGNDLMQFSEFNQVSGKNIHSILTARTGDVWFSNDNGLYTLSRKTQKLKEIKLPVRTSAQVISLFEDEKGRVWAGTFGNGLLCIHPEHNQVRLFGESEGLSNGNILSITGKGNKMWLATLGGAYTCDISENPFEKGSQIEFINKGDEQFPGNNYIYSVFIDSRNRTWFGTDGKGITMLENSRFTRFDKSNGLKSNIVYSVAEDSDGGIWFSTANAGIYCYNGKTLRNYSLGEGLSDLHITGLLADKNHHLLIVHNNGVDILDTRSNTFLYYTASVGLSEINPDLNVCSLEGTDIAWLGTQKGIIKLQFPADLSKRQPSLEIHKVTVFLGSENFIGIHRFAYNHNHISFHFNAYWFIEPSVVRYQIRLKGYDLDWIDTRNNLVTYSNLPPGDYTFEVRSSIKGDFNLSDIKSYTFTIRNPFWKTNWFIIVLVFGITLLIYFFIRFRESALKKREAINREKLMFQFQTLRSQVNPHFLFNSFSTLISVIDEDKEIAIEYVEKLSLFFRNILEYRDKDLIPLNEELKLIETYFYLQKKRYCDNLQLTVEINEKTLTSLIPPMVLQMLVENAIKHSIISAEKPLTVEIIADEKYITITNNLQRKKDKEPSTGIGLTNIRNRYALLGFGEIGIDAANDRFIVQLPIIYTEK